MNAAEVSGGKREDVRHCVSVLFFIVKYAGKQETIRIIMPSLASGQNGDFAVNQSTVEPFEAETGTRMPVSSGSPRRCAKVLNLSAGGQRADCTWTQNLSRTGVPPGTRRRKNEARRVECNLSGAAFTQVRAQIYSISSFKAFGNTATATSPQRCYTDDIMNSHTHTHTQGLSNLPPIHLTCLCAWHSSPHKPVKTHTPISPLLNPRHTQSARQPEKTMSTRQTHTKHGHTITHTWWKNKTKAAPVSLHKWTDQMADAHAYTHARTLQGQAPAAPDLKHTPGIMFQFTQTRQRNTSHRHISALHSLSNL